MQQQINFRKKYETYIMDIQRSLKYYIEINKDLIKLGNGLLGIRYMNWIEEGIDKELLKDETIKMELEMIKSKYMLCYHADFISLINKQFVQYEKLEKSLKQLIIIENQLHSKDNSMIFKTHDINSLNSIIGCVIKDIRKESLFKEQIFKDLFKANVEYDQAIEILTNNIHMPNFNVVKVEDLKQILELEINIAD